MLETTPKLSVVMITYNHENYIEQAVRSALMQETDFEYEIIIGEDCSTDRTREILIELHKEHPDKIRLVLNSQNLGMIPNFVNMLSMAQGEYIALCEGDDYWTSPHKLQSQLDYLDANPWCIICGHPVFHVNENDILVKVAPKASELESREYQSKWDDFVTFRQLPTASVVFRRIASPLPEWYRSIQLMGDYSLFVFLLAQTRGYVGYLPEPLGAYRIHSGGVWSGAGSMEKRIPRFLSLINDNQLLFKNIGKETSVHASVYWQKMAFQASVNLVNTYLEGKMFREAGITLLKSIEFLKIPDVPLFSKLTLKLFLRWCLQSSL